MSRQLLKFEEERHRSTKENVHNFAMLLVRASEEIERLKAGTVEPNDLKDGNFIGRVLDFYRKEWASNPAFKHVSYEKYLEFIELDLINLKLLQEEYNSRKDYIYSFYVHNDPYFSYCEYRFKEGLEDASSKVSLNISDMFKLNGKQITVKLDEEYFKLYTTNARQIEKIDNIRAFVAASKKMDLDYEMTKKAVGPWVKDLAYSLDNYKIDYYYLLVNVR